MRHLFSITFLMYYSKASKIEKLKVAFTKNITHLPLDLLRKSCLLHVLNFYVLGYIAITFLNTWKVGMATWVIEYLFYEFYSSV